MKLYNRLSSFYIVINVPKCLRKRIGKSQIWRSLHTKDRRIANLRAGMIKMSVHKLFTEEQMKEAQEIDGMLRDISCDGIGHSEMDYTEDFAEMVAYEACREKVNYAKTYLVSEMIEEYQQKLKIYRDTYKQGDYKLAYNALTVTVAKHYYPMPTDETMHIALNAMMRAEIQFLEYAIAYIKGSRQNLVGQLISCRLGKAVRRGGFLCYIRKQLPGRKLFYTFLCRAESSGGFFFRVQCAGGNSFCVELNFVVNLVHMFLQFGHLLFNTDFLLFEHIQPLLKC